MTIFPPDQPLNRTFRRWGKTFYRLEESARYEWIYNGLRLRITAPEGFESDGGSIPRALWSLSGLNPDGAGRTSYLFHDVVYRASGKLPSGILQIQNQNEDWVEWTRPMTRLEADKLFCHLLRVAGVGKIVRRIAYYALRAGGALAWNSTIGKEFRLEIVK